MINKELALRKLPPLREREEMLDILLSEEYGYLPPKPTDLTFTLLDSPVPNFCAGKATLDKITVSGKVGGRAFSFPFYASIPTEGNNHPFFIHINFRDSVPDRYMPTEELIDSGFAVLSFCHNDVTKDNSDFTDGLAGVLYPDGKRGEKDAGKIAMWAWAAHRVMDYAEALGGRLDLSRSVVCGHSRLGKTALLTAATDERFAFAYSNDSGCSGAAISRGKVGESVADICRVFPYWFCESYQKYAGCEASMPFDQHYLIASIAPRPVCVGSATEDEWADPRSEMLSCLAASPAFEKMGKLGFLCDGRFAESDEAFLGGSIGYHLRRGTHYFSREDWHRIIEFVKSH